jgi:hypothetical protein
VRGLRPSYSTKERTRLVRMGPRLKARKPAKEGRRKRRGKRA